MTKKKLAQACYGFDDTHGQVPLRHGSMHIEEPSETITEEQIANILGETPSRPRMPMDAESYSEMLFCLQQAENKEDILDVVSYYTLVCRERGETYMAAALAALAAKIESGESEFDFLSAIKRAVSA
jgi:hypothetical protein